MAPPSAPTYVFPVDLRSPLGRARLSLEGLSVGDAFGQRFFVAPRLVSERLASRELPGAPWYWTDDTAMALSVYDTLRTHGRIDRDALAMDFAQRYRNDPRRGYGGTAQSILMSISLGGPWREIAGEVFEGGGSMGNGGAMRVGPVGAYFADDLDRVVAEARASAEPTHAHADGQAGAIAAALAAAFAWRRGQGDRSITGEVLLAETHARTPSGETRDGIAAARAISLAESPVAAAVKLGSGQAVISSDTVPFSLWCAARHLDDYTEALWSTVSGLGDRDTTCAIVGSIVALSAGHASIPRAYVEAREALDSRSTHLDRHGEHG